MKQYSKKLFSVAMLLSTASLIADENNSVSPYLQFRSQGRNTARKVVGSTSYAVDQADMDSCYGTFDMTLEYDRSFRPQQISEALFGKALINTEAVLGTTTTTNNNCNDRCDRKAILIEGSNPNGLSTATTIAKHKESWYASNFFLPDEYQGTLSFKPLVQNVLVNFDWYMGLDRWAQGLYFRLYGPVVNMRTNLRAEEELIAPTSKFNPTDPGFFAPVSIPTANLFSSALQYFNGSALPGTTPGGITYMPLAFAKFDGCNHSSKTGFAELRGEFGWNYLSDNYRVGLNVQAAAPTGTRPNAEWLLPAVIGNGKHWELGAGLKALWTMWRSEDEEKHFDFVFEADVTHLFKSKQRRTFDLIGKESSRYMLAEKLVSNTGTPASATNVILANTSVQFGNVFSPVANFSTQDCKVSIGAQGDLVAMFTYTRRGFSWDLGYNFWGMSTEKITVSCDNDDSNCPTGIMFTENTWALKGDAYVYGTTTNSNAAGVNVALAATESKATIYQGTNIANFTTFAASAKNSVIDNQIAALANNGAAQNIPVNVINNAAAVATNPINTSVPPVFIKATDFDIEGAEMRGYSNKVFTHFNYTWTDRERWNPYVGAGMSAEFGCNNGNDDCPKTTTVTTTNACNSSHNKFALSQWAIWLKGGVSFH